MAAGAVDASRWMTSRTSRREISKPQGRNRASRPLVVQVYLWVQVRRTTQVPTCTYDFAAFDFLGRMGREWPVW